jgi:hypothetical protein
MWPHWHIPTFRITITGTVVSAYAAVVSTLTGIAQVWNYWRDKVSVKVSVRHNMQIYGDYRYTGLTLTIVTVANIGRRPVTITSVGASLDYPDPCFVLTDTRPTVLPHELTEGKNLKAICTPDGVDLSRVLWWSASDAVGREYYSNGTWFRRWLWVRRLKKGAKKEAKDKKTA